ncbi:hypothetical protein BAXH7_00558 [Bacillus amyloliquefaciens XH7]|nr:hypothetical protein LL3_00547 [Bacillus amyloliquefaciens LL3]AEK87704.1 hypothetical protein BAXH7_00558 [Bacillus amyloliquefaciens XH7]KYC93170.1 hypothetical protein B425_0541 [Bacillus amyloliquefaciens]QBG54972.1 hypothetical protein D2M30_0614 [Bacillus amyloliquefaciens]
MLNSKPALYGVNKRITLKRKNIETYKAGIRIKERISF